MAVTDIATRTYNHGWRLDPIVRSLLDTDFYKLLMLQMIREFYPDTRTTFSVINRSKLVRLAEIIDEGELRAQLDHARSIRFSKKELIWLAGLRLSDVGTRRRHGFLWQRWCVEAVKEGLGPSFTGTSNVLLAMDNDLEAIGTNAHELPMVAAALANDDTELRWAPYRILDQWRHTYGGNLLIALPDAYGTKSFLRDAPEWVAEWTGFRPDSAPPIAAGEEIIKWWKQKGRDPKEKLLVFSDAMDVGSIEDIYHHFAGRVRISFGWGTNLTNDFVGCAPDGSVDLDPISIVCKVTSVDGRPAVKLSDNPEKATGDLSEVERYLRVFGNAGRVRTAVHV